MTFTSLSSGNTWPPRPAPPPGVPRQPSLHCSWFCPSVRRRNLLLTVGLCGHVRRPGRLRGGVDGHQRRPSPEPQVRQASSPVSGGPAAPRWPPVWAGNQESGHTREMPYGFTPFSITTPPHHRRQGLQHAFPVNRPAIVLDGRGVRMALRCRTGGWTALMKCPAPPGCPHLTIHHF